MTLQSRSQFSQRHPQKRYVVSPLINKVQKMTTRTRTTSTSNFKSWPVAMVESNGDYRDETYLEDLVGGPLYSAQKSLPKLPIPTIEETISSFLPTALPLAESEEEVRNLKEACKAFPDEAAQLHERLMSRKDDEMKNTSWLQLWWNTAGYLQGKNFGFVSLTNVNC
jgi:hypothetical protein